MAHTILRIPEICDRTGECRSTIYNRIRDGLWPKLIGFGPRLVGQPDYEVDQLITARIAGRSIEETKALVLQLLAARKSADQVAVSPTTEAAEKPREPRKKREPQKARAKPKGARPASKGTRAPQLIEG